MKDSDYYQIIKSSDVVAGTKTTNILNLKKLARCVDKPLEYIINNPDEIYPKIAECFQKINISDASLFTSIGSLMSLIKWSGIKEHQPDLYKKWSKKYFKPLSKCVSDFRESNMPTNRQKLSMIKWQTVVEVYNQISRQNPYTMNHVFLSMCILLPVRRQADYSKIKLYYDHKQQENNESNDETGWIDLFLEKPTISVIVYKTSKNYNKWTKELPDKLLKIIKKSLVKFPRKYLLVDPKGNPWNSVNSFTQHYNRFLKRLFDNKNMSLNSLRHSYASYLGTLNLSVKERKEISADMAHSYQTNMTYAFKNTEKTLKKVVINGKKYYLTPAE